MNGNFALAFSATQRAIGSRRGSRLPPCAHAAAHPAALSPSGCKLYCRYCRDRSGSLCEVAVTGKAGLGHFSSNISHLS
jgi:hypothetical protein